VALARIIHDPGAPRLNMRAPIRALLALFSAARLHTSHIQSDPGQSQIRLSAVAGCALSKSPSNRGLELLGCAGRCRRSLPAPVPRVHDAGGWPGRPKGPVATPCGHRESGARAPVKGNKYSGFLHATVHKSKISVVYHTCSIVSVQTRPILVFKPFKIVNVRLHGRRLSG